ncbi:MAG: glycosyltransferase family 8 protein [Akkermansia muciniphila]
MNIVYATDDNGALGTGVSIVSLMENLPPGVHADIYIMTGGLSGDNTARFHSLQQGYNLHLHFIDMKDKYTDFPVGSKWSAATYYRLGLAGELPATVERALYVDIDTIFNRDISPMYESEFGDWPHCRRFHHGRFIRGVFFTLEERNESGPGLHLHQCRRHSLPYRKNT